MEILVDDLLGADIERLGELDAEGYLFVVFSPSRPLRLGDRVALAQDDDVTHPDNDAADYIAPKYARQSLTEMVPIDALVDHLATHRERHTSASLQEALDALNRFLVTRRPEWARRPAFRSALRTATVQEDPVTEASEWGWPELLGLMVLTRQDAQKRDVEELYEWDLPRVPRADRCVAPDAPHEYIEFLRHVDGWPHFFQFITLFGCSELTTPPAYAHSMIDLLPELLDDTGLTLADISVIGASEEDPDILIMVRDGRPARGDVLWIADEGLVERWPSFRDAFLGFVELSKGLMTRAI